MYKRELHSDTIVVPDVRRYKGMMKNIKMEACDKKYNYDFSGTAHDYVPKRSRRFP